MLDTLWKYKNLESFNVPKLSGELNISATLAKLLINKGYTDTETARKYLNPSLNDLHNPFLLKDMDLAVKRISMAIKNKEKVCIYGDFDVDGVTSTSISFLVLKRLGADVSYYIPNRFKEGYGLNKDAIKGIYDEGVGLLISVDCGITGVEEVDYANSLGLDVVITDHHEQGEALPSAYAVVNPKRKDCTYPYDGLAGVGVAYKLMCALVSKMDGHNIDKYLTEYLDIVAFGTVADIVPLKDECRVIVKKGLELLNSKNVRLGIDELINISSLKGKVITAGQIGFQLAPRINACGRLGDAKIGVELLTTSDIEKAKEISGFANQQNKERKEIENAILEDSLSKILPPDKYKENVIVLASKDWHAGIQGIVASNIVEKYHKPVILGTINDEGVVHCSGRSIEEFDIHKGLQKCSEFLTKFGGHKQAAGMAFPLENLDKFRDKLNKIVGNELTVDDFKPKTKIDIDINFVDIDFELYEELKLLEPFGMGNSEPVLACKEAFVIKEGVRIGANKNHLKLSIFESGTVFDCLFWQMGELADSLPKNTHIGVAFKLNKNDFNGRSNLQLIAKDIKLNDISKVDFNSDNDNFIEKMFKNVDKLLQDKQLSKKETSYQFTTTFKQVSSKKPLNGDVGYLKIEDDSNKVNIISSENTVLGYLKDLDCQLLFNYIKMGVKYKCVVLREGSEGVFDIVIHRNNYSPLTDKQKNSKDVIEMLIREKRVFLQSKNTLTVDGDLLLDSIKSFFLESNSYNINRLNLIKSVLSHENTINIIDDEVDKTISNMIIPSFLSLALDKTSIILCLTDDEVIDKYSILSSKLSQLGINIDKGLCSSSKEEKTLLFSNIKKNSSSVLILSYDFLKNYIETIKELLIDKIELLELCNFQEMCFIDKGSINEYDSILSLSKILNVSVILDSTTIKSDNLREIISGRLDVKNIVSNSKDRIIKRIITNKSSQSKEDYLINLVKGNDKIIVYVDGEKKAMKLADHLRKESPLIKNKIAFLNSFVEEEDRKKIKNMFNNKEISVIITSSKFFANSLMEVNHIVHYHPGFNFIDFISKNMVKSYKNKEIVIHLLFNKDDIKRTKCIINNSVINKDIMKHIYTGLKLFLKDKKECDENSLVSFFSSNYAGLNINRHILKKALAVFEDMNLIHLFIKDRDTYIKMLPVPDKKNLLENSLSFVELTRKKVFFDNYIEWLYRIKKGADSSNKQS